MQRSDQSALSFQVENKLKRSRRRRLPKPLVPLDTRSLERSYFRELMRIIDSLRDITRDYLFPLIENHSIFFESARPKQPRQDGIIDDIKRGLDFAISVYFDEFDDDELENMAERFARRGEQFNRKEIAKNFGKVLNVNPFFNEPFLQEEIELFKVQNVSLIKSLSGDYFDEVEQIVFSGMQRGTLPKDMISDISKLLDPKKIKGKTVGKVINRARFIARDQIAKLNGQLTKLRHQNLGIKRYRWQTSGDDRVRPTHVRNSGKFFSWDDPPATGHPGQDFQCRCVAIPVFEDFL